MEIRSLRDVERDVVDAARWYESQRTGLGDEFRAAVEAAFEQVRRMGKSYPLWRGDVRVITLGRFPYGVYYQVVSDEVIRVLTIRHLHRHPDTALDRGEE